MEKLDSMWCILLCLSRLPQPFPLDPHRCYVLFMSVSIVMIVQATSVALTHLVHREKLERCWYVLIWYTLYSDSIGERYDKICGKNLQAQKHIACIMDMFQMRMSALL